VKWIVERAGEAVAEQGRDAAGLDPERVPVRRRHVDRHVDDPRRIEQRTGVIDEASGGGVLSASGRRIAAAHAAAHIRHAARRAVRILIRPDISTPSATG